MLVIHPPQDTLEKAAGLSGCCPDQAADSAPRYRTPLSSCVLVLTGLTLHEDLCEMRSANAIQENGVPRDQNKNASRMLALPVRHINLPESYYTAAVTDCQGKNSR